MAISQLYPNQRPTLNLNFARSKALDPRITFTRNSTATYVGSDGLIKTTAAGEARFDHDPVTGECLGLLLEQNRTNVIQYSEDYNATGWAKFSVSSTANSGTAPDGTNTASLVQSTANAQTYLRYTVATSGIATITAYLKGGTSNFAYIYLNGALTKVDLSLGTIGAGSGGNGTITTSIENVGNGWYRCALTTYSTANNDKRIYVSNPDGSFNGAIGGNILVWGVQCEEGGFPTSYIPTSGSTVQRLADVCIFNDSNVFGSSSGTFIVDATVFAATGNNLQNQYVFIASAATTASSVSITAGSNYSFQVYDSTYTGLVNYGAYTSGVRVTTAGAYAPGSSGSSSADVAFASDGEIRGTNTATGGSTIPTGMYQMYLFRTNSGVASSLSTGYLHRLAFYPTRLSNSQLEELTS